MRGLTLVAVFFAFLSPIFAARHSFRTYQPQHGLDETAIQCLVQDREGFLWIGTRYGLFRFDGSRFRRFLPADGLPGPNIQALHESSDGTLWIATSRGLAVRQGDRFVEIPGGAEFRFRFQSLASDRAGHVYVGAWKGLFVSERPASAASPFESAPATARFRAVALPPDVQPPISSLVVAPDDTVWMAAGRVVLSYRNGAFETYGTARGVPLETWDSILVDRDQNVWVRAWNRLLRKSKLDRDFSPVDVDNASRDYPNLGLDPHGRLIVPTLSGLWVYHPTGWEQVGETQGLPDSLVSAAYSDAEGALWIGMPGFGLGQWLGYETWRHYTQAEGLTVSHTRSVARDADGNLWIGTSGGVTKWPANGGKWQSWTQRDGLPNVPIRNLVAGPGPVVWVSTPDDGLVRIHSRTGVVEPLGDSNGLPSPRRVVWMDIDEQNTLWVSFRDRTLFRADAAAPKPRFEPVPLPPQAGSVYRVRSDKKGGHWMATTEGLLHYSSGKWRRYTTADGLRHNELIAAAVAPDGVLWVGYGSDLGCTRILVRDGGRLETQHFDTSNSSMRSPALAFLEFDRSGMLWYGSTVGLDRFDGRSWRHLGLADGLVWQSISLGAFWADHDGTVWVGTSRGLAEYRPRNEREPPVPRVVISEIRYGDRVLPQDSPPVVRYDGSYLRVRFARLPISGDPRTVYRYRIGDGGAWNETEQPELFLPDVQPGVYRVELIARNRDTGASSQTASFEAEIVPLWWQSPWIRISLFAAAAFLVWLAWSYWAAQNRQRTLEAAVRQRTGELQLQQRRTEEEMEKVEQQKREIERLWRAATDADRLKGEFLAAVSHEIRTPMNGVLGMAHLALSSNPPPEQREYLEAIEATGKTLLQLLNDVLDFSKIEAGRMDIVPVECSLRDLIDEVIRTAAPDAAGKSLDLRSRVAPGVPDRVVLDQARLRQILLNLVSNGIKFTHTGSVRVEVDRVADPAGAPVGLLQFLVEDTGIGIPASKHRLIFEEFRQADLGTSQQYGGTGLGLAICQRLSRLMGGDIGLDSEPGKGSRFFFTVRFELPLSAEDPTTAAPPQPETAAAPPLDILVVEDNLVGQRVAHGLLTRNGHRVTMVSNGRAALEVMADRQFDFVLMDLRMPELDGLETTRAIRARERDTGLPRTPVFMLSANAQQHDRQQCIEAGADGYLVKPVVPKELYAAIARVASRADLARPSASISHRSEISC